MSGPQGWAAPGSALPETTQSEPGAQDLVLPASGAGPSGEPARASLPGGADRTGPGAPPGERVDLLGGEIAFRPLSIAEILDGSIACIRRNPRAVLGLSVAITGVIQILNSLGAYFLIGDEARDELTPEPLMRSVGAQFTLGLIGLVMSAYGTLLLAGLLSPVLSRTLFQQPASLRQVWADARPQLPRLVGTAAVVLGGSLVALAVPILPFVLLLAVDGPAVAGVLAGLIGFPLGLAAMVWLYVLWVLAVPAVVLERQTVFGALRRAFQLSRRSWWRTCGTLLLALVITIFMGFLALRLPFLLIQLIFFGDDPGGGALVGSLAVDTLGRIVSWSLITPFDAGVIALAYIDRRMRREGFDLDVRTRVNANGRPNGQDGGQNGGQAINAESGDQDGDQTRDQASRDPLAIWRPVEFPPVTSFVPSPRGRPARRRSPRPHPPQPWVSQQYPAQPYVSQPYPPQPYASQPQPYAPQPQPYAPPGSTAAPPPGDPGSGRTGGPGPDGRAEG